MGRPSRREAASRCGRQPWGQICSLDESGEGAVGPSITAPGGSAWNWQRAGRVAPGRSARVGRRGRLTRQRPRPVSQGRGRALLPNLERRDYLRTGRDDVASVIGGGSSAGTGSGTGSGTGDGSSSLAFIMSMRTAGLDMNAVSSCQYATCKGSRGAVPRRGIPQPALRDVAPAGLRASGRRSEGRSGLPTSLAVPGGRSPARSRAFRS